MKRKCRRRKNPEAEGEITKNPGYFHRLFLTIWLSVRQMIWRVPPQYKWPIIPAVHTTLFIYGGAGLGKTHLIHAIGNAIVAENPEKIVRYVHAEDYYSDVVRAYQQSRLTRSSAPIGRSTYCSSTTFSFSMGKPFSGRVLLPFQCAD
jgi:hypothetical protein